MKKSIKEKAKKNSPATKKNTRTSATKQSGYKEEVYDHEQQKSYQNSHAAKNKTENTAGPED